MRTTGSDDLYRLIHSLTTEEKGYFKKFALRHSEKQSKHLQLFDAIGGQENFEETSLKKKFSGYTVMKGYLFEMILTSLYLIEHASESHRLGVCMNHAGILNKKGMNKTAQKYLLQAQKIAIADDFFDKQILILTGLSSLQMREIPHPQKWQFINERYAEEVYCMEQRSYIAKVTFESRKILTLLEERVAGRKYKHLINQIDIGYFEPIHHKLSNRAQRVRCEALASYYSLTDQPEKALQNSHNNLQLLEKVYRQNPTQNNALQYYRCVCHYVVSATTANRLKEAKAELAKLRNLDIGVETPNRNFLFQYVLLSQDIALKEGKFDECIKETNRCMNTPAFKKHVLEQMVNSLPIYLNHAIIQLLAKNYQQAYLMLQEIYQLNKAVKSDKINADSLLFNILLQIEQRNYELIPGLLASAKRVKHKVGEGSSFKSVVQFLTKNYRDIKLTNTTQPDSKLHYLIYENLDINRWVKTENK